MSLLEEQHAFYREHVPAQFNEALASQGEKAERDRDAARVLAEMRAVRASIRVEVTFPEEAEPRLHFLEIRDGQMHIAQELERAPFFILRHAADQLPNLVRRCGASVLGFLGTLAGLDGEMCLTSRRVRSLRELRGTLLFEVEGQEGFAIQAGFGVDTQVRDVDATIRMGPEVFEALRRREIDAQEAFFDEKIEVGGNMEIAVGAALAALASD